MDFNSNGSSNNNDDPFRNLFSRRNQSPRALASHNHNNLPQNAITTQCSKSKDSVLARLNSDGQTQFDTGAKDTAYNIYQRLHQSILKKEYGGYRNGSGYALVTAVGAEK